MDTLHNDEEKPLKTTTQADLWEVFHDKRDFTENEKTEVIDRILLLSNPYVDPSKEKLKKYKDKELALACLAAEYAHGYMLW